MPINHHHRGSHDGRPDDPHGVTASDASGIPPVSMGTRKDAGPLARPLGEAGGRFVGRYLGSTGISDGGTNSRFFSPEATGGGASDSLVVSSAHLDQMQQQRRNPNDPRNPDILKKDKLYHVTNRGDGNHDIEEYNESLHGDALGAPLTETNRPDRVLPGQSTPVGRVVRGSDHSRGVVGSLVGFVGDNAFLSAEATGGGASDSLTFPGTMLGMNEQQKMQHVRKLSGQRVVVTPGKSGHTIVPYDKERHRGLPGADLDDD